MGFEERNRTASLCSRQYLAMAGLNFKLTHYPNISFGCKPRLYRIGATLPVASADGFASKRKA